MSLTDSEVATLARQAVDRRDPELDIRIEPADPVDPYRRESAAWLVHVGDTSSYIAASMTAQEALEKLIRDLGT